MDKSIRINVAKTLNISPSAFFEGEVKHFGGDGAMIPIKTKRKRRGITMKKKQIWTTLKKYSETKQDEFLKDLVSVYESHPKHYGLIYAGFITLSVALSVGLGLVAFYAAFWCCAAHFGFISYRYTKKVNRFNEKWDF